MRINTSEMTDEGKRTIYEFLNKNIGNCDIPNVRRTPWSRAENGESKNSYSFERLEYIRCFFNLDKNLFDIRLNEAISGEGHEEEKIKALHSSSLAALLFFYSCSERRPLVIDGIKYVNVRFEVESPCIEGRGNSSIDVLLTSKGEKDLLYLESKFSEYYLYADRCKGISNEYLNNEISGEIYEKLKSGPYLKLVDGDGDFTLKQKGKRNDIRFYYYEGIKQMISHFIGANNGFASKEELQKVWENAETIKLGAIAFDFGKGKIEPYLNDYRKLYKNFAEVANSLGTKVDVIKELMTYQEIFQGDNANLLNDKVKQFYGFNND
jgi:hypothetical protein